MQESEGEESSLGEGLECCLLVLEGGKKGLTAWDSGGKWKRPKECRDVERPGNAWVGQLRRKGG